MTIDARIPLMVNPVKSELDRQMTLADLAAKQQRTDIQGQQWQQEQAAQQQAGQREQVALTAKLLSGVTDEASYQQAKLAAQQYGINIADAPPNYDPEWVGVHHMIASTLLKPDGEAKLTTTAQELRDAGYQPGTPEFIAAMRQRLDMRDSKVISAQAGGQAGLYGPSGYRPIIAPNDGSAPAGAPVGGGNLARPQSKAEVDALPPGTEYMAPDGSVRRKGGAAASRIGSNFLEGL